MRVLSSAELAAFSMDGYLEAERVVPSDEIPLIRGELERLYRSRAEQPDAIDRPSVLIPALRETQTFRTCLRMARQVLGRRVWYSYDRALYKKPAIGAGSPWHQDQAFWGAAPMRTIHFWIPLQDATADSGCLSYVPGSHRNGLLPHSPYGRPSYGGLICDRVELHKVVTCSVRTGSACLHLPTTVHSAFGNRTQSLCCAWTIHFSPYGRLLSWRPSHLAMRLRMMLGRPRVAAKALSHA